jgi:hypothetical protein
LHIGYNGDVFYLLNRKLALYLKGADRFNKIAKKLYPVRQIVREREDIYNAPTYRELPRLVNKINPVKIILHQKLGDKIDAELIVNGNFQGVFLQRCSVYYLFGKASG